MRTHGRHQAIRVLEEARAEVDALLGRLRPRELVTPGVGGGEWSPKDVLGHLATWEGFSLEALVAWERGEPAPIDAALRSRKLSDINAEGVAEKAVWSYARVRREAERTRAALLAAIRGTSDARWEAPATPRGRKPLGDRLGQILVGPGPFAHDLAHVKDLRGFVEERAA